MNHHTITPEQWAEYQRLKQAKQAQPVAWATRLGEYAHIQWGSKPPEYPVAYEVPLYTAPPPRQPEQVQPVGDVLNERGEVDWISFVPAVGTSLYTAPPPRQPLTQAEEAAAFKAWFDAWWLGDGEHGQHLPSQGDDLYANYMAEYTLAFGAWMAAKQAAHRTKGEA